MGKNNELKKTNIQRPKKKTHGDHQTKIKCDFSSPESYSFWIPFNSSLQHRNQQPNRWPLSVNSKEEAHLETQYLKLQQIDTLPLVLFDLFLKQQQNCNI